MDIEWAIILSTSQSDKTINIRLSQREESIRVVRGMMSFQSLRIAIIEYRAISNRAVHHPLPWGSCCGVPRHVKLLLAPGFY
jgi:hypothetical protein